MVRTELSKITCVVDSALAAAVHAALNDLKIPEVFVQGGKQLSLDERSGMFGFGERVSIAENRADIMRFYVPPQFEAGVSNRVAEAADLRLPGRGSLFAETVEVIRNAPLGFDMERLGSIAGTPVFRSEPYTVVCCIVQRGMGETLARTILDMGLCVPVVSFGEGMGLRNKLGLLRITVPVAKEVMYFLVPGRDSELLAGVAIHKARLDRPGQGFLYRYQVRSSAVNLRIRKTAKRHAATFDQVISALDDLRGGSEWRRSRTPEKPDGEQEKESGNIRDSSCLSIFCDVGRAQDFVRAAMDAGAGGATLVNLAWHGSVPKDELKISHARETCDLVIPDTIVEPVLEAIAFLGLFTEGICGAAELSKVQFAVTYRD